MTSPTSPPLPSSAILFSTTFHHPHPTSSPTSLYLIDIPHSLSLSQHLHPPSPTTTYRRILSTSPPLHPFPSTEPKTPAAKARVHARMGHTLHHDLDPAWLTAGLETLKSHLATTHQPWCLDRVLAPPELLTHSAKSRKRKRKQDRRSNPPSRDPTTSTSPPPPQLTSPLSNPTPLPLLHHTSHPNHTLHLPPNSLSIPSPLPIPHPSPSSLPYTLITLDPPYPNRSATRCTTTYPTHPLSHLPIPTLPLSPSTPTTLLLWTTNATRVRTAALALLAAWNAVLIEEWVWLKITAAGEPVTAVEGAWRKPYEVCLVGRADGDANSYVDSNNEATIPSHEAKPPPSAIAAATAPAAVPKRLLIAVPDLHSRKPAAKTLAEGVLGLQPGEYRGLEVFARGASAGWTAWGDEVGVGMGESWWWEDGNEGGGC